MSRQENKNYLNPAQFLKGATAAALISGMSATSTEAQAPWPIWNGPHPISVENGKLSLYSDIEGEDVVATVWNLKDPCTVSILVATSGTGKTDLYGPIGGNFYTVKHETLLPTRIMELQENTLKDRSDLAACPEPAAKAYWLGPNAPEGFNSELPAWTKEQPTETPSENGNVTKQEFIKNPVWTKQEATGDEKEGPAKIGHDTNFTVAEIWDGKNLNTFRIVFIEPGYQLPNETWKGGVWYIENGDREKVAERAVEMAKEQTLLKNQEVISYYVGGNEPPAGLLNFEELPTQETQAIPSTSNTKMVENRTQPLPLKEEIRQVVEQFVSAEGNVPDKLETVNTDAHSMTLETGKTYIVVSQTIESKVLNTTLPQKEDRTHILILQGSGQQVAFTNINPGQLWVGSVVDKLNANFLAEKATEAYGTQTTLTFRKESSPAISASFTVNESEQSVWNSYIGSWVVETGNRNFGEQTNQSNITTKSKAQEESLENIRMYDISKEKPTEKDNYTLIIAWDGENVNSTRVVLVEAGTKIESWQYKQGTAWVVKGSRETVLKRAKEMASEVAKNQGTQRLNPVYAGTLPIDSNEFVTTPSFWNIKKI